MNILQCKEFERYRSPEHTLNFEYFPTALQIEREFVVIWLGMCYVLNWIGLAFQQVGRKWNFTTHSFLITTKFAYLGCHLLGARASITPLDVIARHTEQVKSLRGLELSELLSSDFVCAGKDKQSTTIFSALWIFSASEQPFSQTALQWINISHFRRIRSAANRPWNT